MSNIEEYITTNFQLLPDSLSPVDALAKLEKNNYGVVINELQQPVALVLAEDLERAKRQGIISLFETYIFPPCITVDCREKMSELLKSELMEVLDEGARGAIAIDDREIQGILSIEKIGEYIGSDEYQRYGRTMMVGNAGANSDSQLGGKHQSLKCLVKCTQCGFLNELLFLDRRNLPNCQNPHKQSHTLKIF